MSLSNNNMTLTASSFSKANTVSTLRLLETFRNDIHWKERCF